MPVRCLPRPVVGNRNAKNTQWTKALSAISAFVLVGLALPAFADTLDDVVAAGTLRCAVVLDFPPMGYRDPDGTPQGFDVEYCKDLAASLDVSYEILPVTWPERVPAITEDKVDVVFGGTSITLERARQVGFSIPYAVFFAQAVVAPDSGIETFDDLKGKRVGAAASTLQETEFLKIAETWGTNELYQSLANEAAVVEALANGDIDAGIVTNTEIAPLVEQYPDLKSGPRMPWPADVTAVAAPRTDVSWLNYINLFIVDQVRSGRYQELWQRFANGDAPDLTVPGVSY